MKKVVMAICAALLCVGCCECRTSDKCSTADVVVDNILTRRSIRDYKEEPVCREQMRRVVECGLYAPNAMNKQTWAVRVVDSKEFIDGVTSVAVAENPAIKEQANFRNIFRNAPTVAFIAVPEESYSGEFDAGLLSENMMLSAWSMGIGSCCLGSVVPVMNSVAARPYLERLQLPEGYKLLVAIAFGYPSEEIPEPTPRDMGKGYYVE